MNACSLSPHKIWCLKIPLYMPYRFGRICKCYMSLSKVDPPTAQTDHHKDLKFGMDTHLVPNRGAIEAIF